MIKFVTFTLLMLLQAGAFAQECPMNRLALMIGERYYADDDYNVPLQLRTETRARITGAPGPYSISVVSDNGTPVDDILDYRMRDSTLVLEGVGEGTVLLEIANPQQTTLRLRLHVGEDLGFPPPPRHFFRGGATMDGGDTFRDRVRRRDRMRLTGVLCPYAEEVGQSVDVLVVARVMDPQGAAHWFYVTGENAFRPWDTRVGSLQPFLADFPLQRNYRLNIFDGRAPRLGRVDLYVGYMGDEGLVYDPMPQAVTIEDGGPNN